MNKKVIQAKKAPQAIGPYSVAIELDDFIFLSGQIPLNPDTNSIPEGIKEQTKQVLQNIDAILESCHVTKDHIVKTTVFMNDLNEFMCMNQVYEEYFDEVYPARSCIEVGRLPKDVKLEIECIVKK